MDLLKIIGNQIVDQMGHSILLRGTSLGGWMNMENFISGFPGVEHSLRRVMSDILGQGLSAFFFDRFLDHMITEADIVFIRETGANVVRIPLNYRHFEDDREPFKYLERGFERLKQVVDWCSLHGLYVILDLHAAQGWQNQDWHSDNANRHSLFWDHLHFQERFLGLWKEIARRYKGNSTIAAYDALNEPSTNAPNGKLGYPWVPDWNAINQLYRRTVNAIRSVDPDHIIFLEGDGFAWKFSGFEPPFAENLGYSSHNYCYPGFGPGAYPGVYHGELWDAEKMNRFTNDHEGTQFGRLHNVPIWAGEFGSVYNGSPHEISDRMRALDDQLVSFNNNGIHWTTWTYKDVDVMSWLYLHPESAYLETVRSIVKAKEELHSDFWMSWLPMTQSKSLTGALAKHIGDVVGDPEIDATANQTYVTQSVLDNYAGSMLQYSYAKCFKGMTEEQIDDILRSFSFEQCLQRQEMIRVLKNRLV